MSSVRLPRAAPETHGVDPRGIVGLLDAVAADGLDLHGFLLWRRGAVVAEGFWRPYAANIPHGLHSATKSWTAAAVGLAVDDGLLRITDKVVDFFPEHLPATVSATLAAMTVEDLLTMRTGHRTGISGGEWRGLRESWIRAFLAEEVAVPPGTDFIYSSASSYMLSAIVTRVTGQTLPDFLAPRLFRPLGMGPIAWDLSPEGIATGGNGLTCLTEDLLKFGLLHLQRGAWEGRQILSAAWVDAATRNHVADVWIGAMDGRRYTAGQAERREGYGYQWWMTPGGGYWASGIFGQHCIVLPAQQAVIVLTSGVAAREPRLVGHVFGHLVPALVDGARPDPALAGRLAGLAKPELPGAAHAGGEGVLGAHRWRVEPNEDGVTELGFGFSGNICRFSLADDRGLHVIEMGLGRDIDGTTTMTGYKLHHAYQPPALRVLARGAWQDSTTFHMTWRFVETAFTDTVVCRFVNGALHLARSVNTNAGPLERPVLIARPV